MLYEEIRKKLVNHFYMNQSAQRRIIAASRYYHRGGIFRAYGLLLHQHNRRLFPCEVYPYVKIGKNFSMPHCVGILVVVVMLLLDLTV